MRFYGLGRKSQRKNNKTHCRATTMRLSYECVSHIPTAIEERLKNTATK